MTFFRIYYCGHLQNSFLTPSTMKLKHKIDYIGLRAYLMTLKLSDIETNWNKPENPKLMVGIPIDEIEYCKSDKSKIPFVKVIQYGEPFLIEALGNDLSIVILSKRKHRLPTGRVITAKYVKNIIDDCNNQFGTPLNGYWKIPEQFIQPL